MEPPDFGLTLILYAFFTILSEIIRPKPNIEKAKPAGLGDFSFPTATEGRVVPLIWGTNQITGPNVIWYGDLKQVPITKKQKTGLFSSIDIVVGFKYYVGMQFGLARGIMDSLTKVWIGDDLVFSGTVTHGNIATINKPDLFGGDDLGQGGVVGNLRFMTGTETQTAPDYISAFTVESVTVFIGSGGGSGYTVNDLLTVSGGTFSSAATLLVTSVNGSGAILTADVQSGGSYLIPPSTPAAVTGGTGTGCTFNLFFTNTFQEFVGGSPPGYRGTCYCLFEGGYIGNSTSIKPWKFEVTRIPNGLGLSTAGVNSGKDANPMNVIYEVMTNTDWGMGIPAATINAAGSFTTAANTLRTENNGFSFVLDRAMEASEFLNALQTQIDGIVYLDQLTGMWEVKLARGGYDVTTVPNINSGNCVRINNFSRGSWEETTNQVRLQFVDRDDQYKGTFATAQDMANIRIQNGTSVSTTLNYYGVKNKSLANNLVWRELRTLSYPLAKAQVVVDRTFYATHPTDVVSLTMTIGTTDLVQFPMRVTRIDLGEITKGEITLDLVEDIFVSRAASYGDPPDSGWTPPSANLQPFLASEQQVFEAPRGFTSRALGTAADRIWCGARKRGPEVGFRVVERHAVGAPSGAFAAAGEGFGFLLIGKLNASLAAGTAVPTSSIVVTPFPDVQADLIAAFDTPGSPQDSGLNLVNLLLVGNEFMLATAAGTSGGNVALTGVYRGVLDSVQAAHAAGDKVWLVFAGGVLTDVDFVPGNTVDLKLLPETSTDVVAEGDATTVQVVMANRLRKPYAPSSVALNGSTFPSTASLEGTGSGADTFGILAHLTRRDFRTTDEVAALSTDAATLFADFPTANGTTHELDVRNDPAGANTLLFTLTTGTQDATALRTHILRFTNGVLPTRLRLAMRAKHTEAGTLYSSLADLVWDFNVTTALTGQFNFGAKAASSVSNLYTTTVTGTYNFTLSSAFTTGTVEYRVNGGAFLPLITAGNTTGAIVIALVGDTIELRHSSTDTGAEKFLAMDAPGAGQDGYMICYV